mmetsp:Transcript_50802/g.61227  ORF Transcript_50802/g.61227 Transcript_50802/m.61227 type:complete len:339 (+) Transcript_50802:6-1022(+)
MSFFDDPNQQGINNLGEGLGDEYVGPGGDETDHHPGEPPPPGTIEAISYFPGRYYSIQVFSPSLGVKFNTAQDLEQTGIYLCPDPNLIESIGDLPVVAFVFQNSAARRSGVGVGHVLIRIDDEEVYRSKDVAVLMKNRGRPVTCEFYIPNTEIVKAEGPALVQYDVKTTKVPTRLKDWKFKYVVVGGIISQPFFLRMYQSRAEYDRAVTEVHQGRHVTVKIKTFDLKYARLLDDFGEAQEVHIKEKPEPWRYIVLLPGRGHPIKIAAPSLAKLRPIHDTLRRVIAELDAQDPLDYEGRGSFFANDQFDGGMGQYSEEGMVGGDGFYEGDTGPPNDFLE